MSNALAIRHTAEDSQARVNAASNAQVKRYWPGRAPEWYDGERPGAESSESSEEDKEAEPEEETAVTAVAAPVVLKKVADPRLARLAATTDGVAAPRVISRRQARGDSDDESASDATGSSGESEEEDEEVTARRLAVRERLKKKKAVEEELLAPAASDAEEEEEEEESEYETDSDDETYGRQMLKPIFVTKKDRETIAEREALEREEMEVMKREKVKLAERAQQTKELVVEQLRVEEAERAARREGPKDIGDIDTDDERDPEGEYETWRIRELQRIRRDRDEREALKDAEAERERLRSMTAEQRAAFERENPRLVYKAPKKSWKFMQKYWHKGAFFQNASDGVRQPDARPDDIYLRDYSAPVGDDKLNREMLPKVMQVKNFGRRGRTKYTHLVDQDTSLRDDYHTHDGLRKPSGRRLAGTDQVFEKPKKLNT